MSAVNQHDHLERFEDDPIPLTPKQKKLFRRRFCCVDCGKCTLCSGEYYMVKDEPWAAAGIEPNGGMLCLLDLERRIGRTLTADDWTTMGPSLDAWQQQGLAGRPPSVNWNGSTSAPVPVPISIGTGASGALAQTHIPSAFAPLRIFDWRKLAQTGATAMAVAPCGSPEPVDNINTLSFCAAWL